ncbi:MAG: hypothetical protein K0S14_2631 [Thermomicrobiales bacterium]|jgi:hypothetical protein|nr:hypothetical protein [Thermomicrobiales bacterium]
MDRILSELFGGDEPAAGVGTRPESADRPADPEREASREARQRRKADAETRRNRKEFIERYTTGDPAEGFTTEEAVAHLREMREEMTPEEFRRAMRRTLEHLPPHQRDDFIRIMREYQAGPSQPAPGAATAAGAQAREGMAREESTPSAAARARSGGDPFGGLLTGLMGGGAVGAGGVGVGDLLDDLARGGLRAPASTPGKQPTEADFHTLLNSPLGRAVLGGVAAFGMQEMEEEETPGTR